MMEDNQDIKKSIKATSLFGGVQVFSILVSIVRTKLVALLIGPTGVGIVELYNSTIKLITSLTDFSLYVSAVRDVTIVHKSGNSLQFNHVVSVLSRILWGTGLLGTLVCLLGSPLWSKMTFGNYDYTIGFAVLSVTLLLTQLNNGKSVILQATEHYKYLAYSGIIGNVCGLITTVPIYYFWGIDGVIAVLLLVSLSPYIIASYFTSKLKIEYQKVKWPVVVKEGSAMLKQGFFLSVNFILSTLVFYALRIFITNRGGVAEVGLYSSSFVIVNTYVGMIFSSMSQEYYPRISSLADKKDDFTEAINSQIYLSLLLLGPMIIIFLVFSDKLLLILYSEKFVSAGKMMALAMLGVIFQAPSWCMGYAFLAKGDNKVFFVFETIAKAVGLALNILCYYYWGLTGLGFSFVLGYFYYALQCFFVCKKRYGLLFKRAPIIMVTTYFLVGVFLISALFYLPLIYRYILGLFCATISILYSYRRLNRIINISYILKSKFYKRNK